MASTVDLILAGYLPVWFRRDVHGSARAGFVEAQCWSTVAVELLIGSTCASGAEFALLAAICPSGK